MGASKTADGGGSWTRYNFGTVKGGAYTIVMDPVNNSILYAGGFENAGTSVPAIYKTTDAGASWVKLAGAGLSGTAVNKLVINPDNPNTLLAGTQSTIYKSTDGGSTWATTGFPGGHTRTFATLVDGRATTVFAGTYSNGVYSTANFGATWTQMNNGLDNLNINSLRVSSGRYLFAGTDGASGYRWWLPVGIEETPGNIPDSSNAFKVGPNPARGRVRIDYYLARPSRVKIAVYDIRGCRVATVVDGCPPAGANTAEWDCRGQAGGVYFVKAVTDQGREVRKLILAR